MAPQRGRAKCESRELRLQRKKAFEIEMGENVMVSTRILFLGWQVWFSLHQQARMRTVIFGKA